MMRPDPRLQQSEKNLNARIYILLGVLFSFTTLISTAQLVNIPDANFKTALISNGVDINFDGEISVSEALVPTSLTLNNSNISNLTGIEAFENITGISLASNQLTSLNLSGNSKLTFINCTDNQISSLIVSSNTLIKQLYCDYNLLTSIDLTSNKSLEHFTIDHNQLTSLELSENTALILLQCSSNPLTEIDLSKNTALTHLYCYYDQLTSLDISNNTNLIILECWHNQLSSLVINAPNLLALNCSQNNLTSLDLSGCSSLTSIKINQMPDLENVCVWEIPFPPAGVIVEASESPKVVYSNTCITGIENVITDGKYLNIFPTPSYDFITVEVPGYLNEQVLSLKIIDVCGRLVFESALIPGRNQISVRNLSQGLYIVRITDHNTKIMASGKIIRQ